MFQFPSASEICAEGDQIRNACTGIILHLNFYLFGGLLAIIVLAILKKFKLLGKLALIYVITLPLLFWLTDRIMLDLSEVSNFDKDIFLISFYGWWFLSIVIFLCALLFGNLKKFIVGYLLFTLLLTVIFIFTGRGTIEHITPLIGGLLADEYKFDYLNMSFVFKLEVVFIAVAVVIWLTGFAYSWIVNGKFSSNHLTKHIVAMLCFLVIAPITIVSLPLGELLNKRDIKEAEDFIDTIIEKVNKAKLENGEYPKVIVDFFEVDSSYPKLLKRHDYLSYGVKGAYYFSRPDKFCFVFQNPARKLGYYSKTSMKGWRFNSYKGSLDEEYINLCDEQFTGSDNIIGGSLGLSDPYSEIEEMAAQVGAQTMKPAITLKANEVLKTLIDEYGKEDPSIYQNPGEQQPKPDAPQKNKQIRKEDIGL